MSQLSQAHALAPYPLVNLLCVALVAIAMSACNDDPGSTPGANQSSNNMENNTANNTAMNNATSANNTSANNAAANNTAANNTANNATTPPECTEDAACDDGDPCMVNICSEDGVCAVAQADDGTSCDDGDACTQADTCQAGVCTGADPVVCEASDQCHGAGVCDPTTGMCSDPALEDGTACDDEDLCTRADTCQAGVCTGADPVTCEASDQCHGVGVCDPTTGACSDPALPDDTACDDGDLCTQADTCQAGVCTGADPVVCAASDQCHDVGVCDSATGMCSDPALPDDTACDDGDLCTQADTCQAGVCTGADPVTCTALSQCHDVGMCDPTTGVCSDPPTMDGTPCDDGDLCTNADTCNAGACQAGTPTVCTASDQCHDVGTCDPSTGACSDPALPDDTACDDSDLCTQADTCQAGVCTGADPVTCTALSQCHDVGVCDSSTGTCSNPPAMDGTLCDDGDLCSENDQCVAGSCEATPVVCMAAGECFVAGTCDPTNGVCSDPLQPDGTGCGMGGTCAMGSCQQIIAQQDFEVSPAGPVWTYTGTPSFQEGFTGANATPANSPIGIGGSRAWHLEANSSGLPLEFANQQIPAGSASRLQFKLAAMNMTGTFGGPDSLDYVLVEISTDGGATFYPRVRIRGASNNNCSWSYNAATTVSVPHLPMVEETFQPQNSGLQEVEGISTVEITFPNTVTQVAVRITMRASVSTDDWLLDNLTLYAE